MSKKPVDFNEFEKEVSSFRRGKTEPVQLDLPGIPPKPTMQDVIETVNLLNEQDKGAVFEASRQRALDDLSQISADLGGYMPKTLKTLDTANELIYGDREKDYGHPKVNLSRIAKMWSALLGIDITPEKVCVLMAALKLSRLIEKPDHFDGRVDVCGYMGLIERLGAT